MKNEKFISLRKEKKLTQAALAEKMEISVPTLRRWEYGETMPSLWEIKKLSEILGLKEEEMKAVLQEGAGQDRAPEEEEMSEDALRKILEQVEATLNGSYSGGTYGQDRQTPPETAEKEADELTEEELEENFLLFQETFRECRTGADFLFITQMFSMMKMSGVASCGNFVFPFDRVIATFPGAEVILADEMENRIVFTSKNIFKATSVSDTYDVYTFHVTVNCPVFPANWKKSGSRFRQKLNVSFFGNSAPTKGEEREYTILPWEMQIPYDVGLNALFSRVYDFHSFCCFIDAISATDFLLNHVPYIIGYLMSGLKKGSDGEFFYEDMEEVDFVYEQDGYVMIETGGEILTISEKDMVRIAPQPNRNNTIYMTDIWLRDRNDEPIRLVIRFPDEEDNNEEFREEDAYE